MKAGLPAAVDDVPITDADLKGLSAVGRLRARGTAQNDPMALRAKGTAAGGSPLAEWLTLFLGGK